MVFLATPVILKVASIGQPSTKRWTIETRSAVLNWFILVPWK
jgi:hypothetical protein